MSQTQTRALKGSWPSVMEEDVLHEERGLFWLLPVSSTLHSPWNRMGAHEWIHEGVTQWVSVSMVHAPLKRWNVNQCLQKRWCVWEKHSWLENSMCKDVPGGHREWQEEIMWTESPTKRRAGDKDGDRIEFRLRRSFWDPLRNLKIQKTVLIRSGKKIIGDLCFSCLLNTVFSSDFATMVSLQNQLFPHSC